MADIAVILSRQMGGGLPRGNDAVMTGDTVVNDARVVKAGQGKRVDRVTEETVIVGGDMSCRFTGADDAVVAGLAVVTNADMVKGARGEGAGGVAVGTVLGGWQVVSIFTHLSYVVMTGAAGLVIGDYTAMVKHICLGEAAGVMADAAVQSGWRMAQGLTD